MTHARTQAGFTLMEVLVAFAVVGTAFVAIVGLQTQSLGAMDRMTRRFEADLWAHETHVRYKLAELGYLNEQMNPLLQERHPGWQIAVVEEQMTPDELPMTVPFPINWEVTWLNVSVRDGEGRTLAEIRPLWARNRAESFDQGDELIVIQEPPAKDEQSGDGEADDGKPLQGAQDAPPRNKKPAP